MQTTVNDIAEYARASIKSLSQHPHYGNLNTVCTELARLSGLSLSTVLKFYDMRKPNPTAQTLDKLVAAIKAATRKAAA